MRNLFIISFILLCQNINAQTKEKIKYSKPLDRISKINIESIYDVIVKTHDSNELIITSDSLDKNPKKVKGLKAFYPENDDNTGVGCYISQINNEIFIKSLRNFKTIKVYIPKQVILSINITGTGKLNITGLESELEASTTNGNLFINEVSGPITVSTLSGAIEIIINEKEDFQSVNVSSLTSDIDLSMPEHTKTNIKMISKTGEIYSNFFVDIENKDKKALDRTKRGLSIIGEINGGGQLLTLRTTSGDIYLRKTTN